MKRTLSLLFAALLLLAFAACGKVSLAPAEKTVPQTEETAAETTSETAANTETMADKQSAAYSYEIRTALDKKHTAPGGSVIEFKFSRPVFAETSPFAKTANQVYDQAEAEYRSRMEEVIADYGGEPYPYGDTRYSTLLCTTSYEANGVVSFVLHGEWMMGGVHNSWDIGHTFDFNQGRELKIRDLLQGTDAEITAALENAFYEWYKQEEGTDFSGDEFDKNEIKKQSGPNANFYLAKDGVHVFYEPYVIPATQNGVDILFPWTSALVRPLI